MSSTMTKGMVPDCPAEIVKDPVPQLRILAATGIRAWGSDRRWPRGYRDASQRLDSPAGWGTELPHGICRVTVGVLL